MATFGPNCMLRMLHFNLLSRYGDQLCAGRRDVTQHENRSESSTRPNMPGLCNSNNTISISKPCCLRLYGLFTTDSVFNACQ
jgi:hypothetical protein